MNIRPLNPDNESERNFILSTWLESYYDELKNHGFKGVMYPKDDVFFKGHQYAIKKTLGKSKALICTAPDDDNQILGSVVFDDMAIHYCYVKQPFRKFGIAKKLCSESSAKLYSHHTKYSRYINKGLTFDPYKF